MTTATAAKAGATFYALWGILHVVGGLFQLVTLQQGGGSALAALVSSAAPPGAGIAVPHAATALMGMGSANIVVVGALVIGLSVLNWRNDRSAFWLSLLLVGGVDLSLVMFLLVPGVMAWTDGLAGLSLYVPAAALSTFARIPRRMSGWADGRMGG